MSSVKFLSPLFRISNYISSLQKNDPTLNITKFIRNVSTHHLSNQESLDKEQIDDSDLKEMAQEKIQLSKPSVVKWKREPFVKNFFFGKFDVELMAFPEILNNEQVAELENTFNKINNLYNEKVPASFAQSQENKDIPIDLLEKLKSMGLFGRLIPSKYGGLDLTYTACTRLNEILGLDWSLFMMLTAHEFFASHIILLCGTEEQKMKYLPNLASGKSIAAICCSEFKSGSDLLSLETSCFENSEGTSYIINGKKSWVTNADIADVFIVFAKMRNPSNSQDEIVSAFIVDKDTEDIKINLLETVAFHGLKFGVVDFQEVKIPKENLLGEIGQGIPIFLKTLENFRIMSSSFTFGTLKALLDSVTQNIIDIERVRESLGDRQLIRVALSKINATIYAMESVSYFTAAILDSTENPDVSLESAILKVFNSEKTLYCLQELMKIVGSSSLLKNHPLEKFFRDAQALALFEGPNDVTRLFIALNGFKLVGAKFAKEIEEMRNPFFFPLKTLKLAIKRQRIVNNSIKYDQDIAGYIHPSLTYEGNQLEASLQKLFVAVNHIFNQHGMKVVETQLDPIRIADIVIDLYAMAAVLSRSSRSYCIGLKNAHDEIIVAETFCKDAISRINANFQNIFKGFTNNNDGNHLNLGGQIIDCRGYFPEHPLKHNF